MNVGKQKDIILFIDDESVCHALIELITPKTYRIISALNGGEAISLADKYSDEICLILSDIVLPDMNGYDVLKTLRKDSRFANIPFIFQSGLSDQENMLKKNINEEVRIIYKPYQESELIKSIDEALMGVEP